MRVLRRLAHWLGLSNGKGQKVHQLDEKAAGFPKLTAWELDPFHTTVGFRVMHMGLVEVFGRFKRYTAMVRGTSPAFSDLQVEAQIEVASVETDMPARDAHLRSADFFNADQYPYITFRSTKVQWRPLRRFVMEGELTIKGITRPIRLEGELRGLVFKDLFAQPRVSFALTGQIDRRDWGLAWYMETADGTVVADYIVTIDIVAEITTPQGMEALRQMLAQMGG